MKKCTSCNRNILNDPNSTRFSCPNCGKEEIVRCGVCRKQGINYICGKCEYEGP